MTVRGRYALDASSYGNFSGRHARDRSRTLKLAGAYDNSGRRRAARGPG